MAIISIYIAGEGSGEGWGGGSGEGRSVESRKPVKKHTTLGCSGSTDKTKSQTTGEGIWLLSNQQRASVSRTANRGLVSHNNRIVVWIHAIFDESISHPLADHHCHHYGDDVGESTSQLKHDHHKRH